MGCEDRASRQNDPKRDLSHKCPLQEAESATIRKKRRRLAVTSQADDVELRVVDVEARAQLRAVR